MKKSVLLAFMLMLLASAVAGTLLIDVGTANPIPPTSTISVTSPQKNKVHTVNNVPLTFSVTTHIYVSPCDLISKPLIKYYLDGKLKGQIEFKFTRDSPTKNFSVTLAGLSDGLHCVTVTKTAHWNVIMIGNYKEISSSGMIGFAVDTTPPRISIRAPLDRTYNATDVPLNFTVREPISWMGYSLDGQANVTITGNTTLSELSYGSHNLTVYANDIAGNTGYSRTIYFSIAQKKEPKQPEPEQSEPFPTTWIVAAIVIIAIGGVVILVYFRKIRKTTGKTEIISEGVK